MATHTYIKLTLVSFFFTFFYAPFPYQYSLNIKTTAYIFEILTTFFRKAPEATEAREAQGC